MAFAYESRIIPSLGIVYESPIKPFIGIHYIVGDLDRKLNSKEVQYVEKPEHKFADRIKHGRDIVKRRPTPDGNNDLTKSVNFKNIEDLKKKIRL